jgi:hypothetical protein
MDFMLRLPHLETDKFPRMRHDPPAAPATHLIVKPCLRRMAVGFVEGALASDWNMQPN